MKDWLCGRLCLLLLTVVMAADGSAQDSVTSPPAVHSTTYIPAPDPQRGILLEAEYFLLAPRREGQTYAIFGRNPFWGPLGEVKSLDGGYNSGFRISAGCRTPDHPWEVMLRYAYFHADNDATLQTTPSDTIFPTLTHPGTLNRADSVSASNHVLFHLADLEIARRFDLSSSCDLRVFAGPRYAYVEQGIGADYRGAGGLSDQVCRCLEFNGGGLRTGAETQIWFIEHLGLYLRGSASLLTGQFTGWRTEYVNNAPIVDISERYTRMIPMFDLGIGLSFQHRSWRVSLGYEFMNWMGMADTSEFLDDSAPSKYQRSSGNLGFDGIVVRAEMSF